MPMTTFREYIFYPGENKNYKPIPLMYQVCEWNNRKQRVVMMIFLQALFPPVFREFLPMIKVSRIQGKEYELLRNKLRTEWFVSYIEAIEIRCVFAKSTRFFTKTAIICVACSEHKI